jgi:hypothetical protein
MGVDLKTAQELLRHANSRTTLDIYTRAVSERKREATEKVVQLLLSDGAANPSTLQHPEGDTGGNLIHAGSSN